MALWDFAKANDRGSGRICRVGKAYRRRAVFQRDKACVQSTSFGSEVAYVKGAPEVVTTMCALPDDEGKIQKTVEIWADHGLKVLGYSERRRLPS